MGLLWATELTWGQLYRPMVAVAFLSLGAVHPLRHLGNPQISDWFGVGAALKPISLQCSLHWGVPVGRDRKVTGLQ